MASLPGHGPAGIAVGWHSPMAMKFTADGRRLLSVGDDRTLRVWEAPGWPGGPLYRGLPSHGP